MSDATAAPAAQEVPALKRYGLHEFKLIHRGLRKLHPRDWKIEWERAPRTLTVDDEGFPIYLKSERSCDPHAVLVHVNGKMVAQRTREGYWETWRYGLAGQLVEYENSLGAWFKQYWSLPQDNVPMERHTGANRWVLVANRGLQAIYWCALTGQYLAEGEIYAREGLWVYFADANWGSKEEKQAIQERALSAPKSALARWIWRATHRDPSSLF